MKNSKMMKRIVDKMEAEKGMKVVHINYNERNPRFTLRYENGSISHHNNPMYKVVDVKKSWK